MNKIISKSKLLATTAICAISMCANTVKAEEIDILSILNNSTTKSPNISWEKVTSAGENTIQIGDGYYKYTWTNNDTVRGKYTEHQYNTLSGNVKADFIGISESYEGGAIFNNGAISSIIGNFINNSALYGVAIFNSGGTISSITGDFIGNRTISTTNYDVSGGAIFSNNSPYNDGIIGDITGDFIGNSANSTNSSADGGAIYNGYRSTITSITGDFVSNSANAITSSAEGGVIYNQGTISSITGDFTNNSTNSTSSSASGGAIHNYGGTIGGITGNFIDNSVTGKSSASAGAIYNYGTISSITGNFDSNSATGSEVQGGAIYNYGNGTIETITGDFTGNSATGSSFAYGGAIYNYGNSTIETITGDFTGNSATGSSFAYGGAIYNDRTSFYNGTISSITGDFIGNSATSTNSWASGGAIYNNSGTIETVTGDFIGNYAKSADDYDVGGGAIYNYGGTIGFVADASDAEDALQDDILFQGNYTQSGSEDKKYEAVHNSGTINFESRNGGSFTFYDSIYNSGTINLTGDGKGIFNMYNDIESGGRLNIKNPYTFNMVNQEANLIEQDYFNIEATSTLNLDVILSTGKSDRFSIEEITGADNFELKEINLVDDMEEGVEYEKIAYSNKTLTKESTYELSTSENVYSVANDGKNLRIEKTDGVGGFAAFVGNSNNLSGNRTYSFTKDEDMRLALFNGKDSTGNVEDADAELTINGNEHTLSYLSGEKSKAMKLKGGQTATINDLTIKGFETGLINNGEMTLNNVTLADNKVALQNSGDISFKGENTISGGEYAMYFEAGKSYEYPIIGAYYDFAFTMSAAEEGLSYAEYMKNMSEEASAETGQTLEFTNGAEYWEVSMDFAKQQGEEVPFENDMGFIQEAFGVDITEAQYNEALETMKQYGEAHPTAGYVAMISLSYRVSPLKFTQLFYSEDASEQEALLDELAAEMFANLPADEKDGITEADVKEELRDMIASGKSEMAEMENMYAQVGAPSPYEYVAPAYTESTFDFAEGAILNLNSKISGEVEYGLTLAGADDAVINLNSEIEKADLVLDGPTLKLSDESTNLASVNSFEVKNGTLDLQNEVVRKLIAPNFKVSGPMSLYVDADLANKTMDTLGKVEVLENGSISVDGIKILSDGVEAETSVEFAEESYKDKVSTTVDNVLSAKYEYAVEYDETTGEFKFVRAEEKAPESVTPNLEVPAAGGIAQTIVDVVTNTVLNRDVSAIGEIKYDPSEDVSEEVTISAIEESKKMRGWVQFLHSEDDVELKNAEDSIDAKFNGLLGGIESKVYTYENGWKAVYGIYGSYVSSTQEFGDTEIDQTGEYYGLNAAFRKGNVFSNLTLTRGFIENEAKTEWGTDKFDTTLVSVSGKAGVDLHKPSLTLTPAIYVAYTQVDTEDYTNKAGIEIENELTHVVTIAPELKLTKNFEEGLNGYAKVSYKTFMYSNNEVKADGVLLPEMSVKPYMEYSVGAEWVEKDNTTLYGEVSRRTGGREGWNVNLGLRLNF